MRKFIEFLNNKSRAIAIVVGSSFVSIWTISRFVSQRADFDLIGQQLLVRQWLSGSHEFASIGITHYLAKMLTLYLPMELLPGRPIVKLIVTTLIVNIITFVLIFILLEKILALFKIKTGMAFNILMMWLASMAGSIFWIQYLNSRNLEIAGGLLLIYLALKYLHTSTEHLLNRKIILIFLVTLILVAADRLQLFMTVMPIIVLTTASALWTRRQLILKAQLIVSLLVASLLAVALIRTVANIFNLHFVEPAHFNLVQPLRIWAHAIIGAMKGFVAGFNGGFDLNKWHRMVNILIAIIVLFCSCYVLVMKRKSRTPILLGFAYIALNILVYVISGQSLREATSRYLIMTAPVLIFIAASSIPYIKITFQKCLLVILLVASILNAGIAIKLTYSKRQVSNTQQQELRQLTNNLRSSGYTYAYTSMNTALTGDYFVKPQTILLPLSCDNGVLNPSFLFFDKSLHHKALKDQKGQLIPIVFDTNIIKNYPAICTPESLIAQIGSPSEVMKINGNVVLLYPTDTLEKLYSNENLQ